MPFSIKTYQAVLDDMKAYVIANQDRVSDFNQGSVMLSFIEAVSRQFEQLFIRSRIGFQESLDTIPYNAFDFEKDPGHESAGQVRFTRVLAAPSDITILSGTRVTTPTGIEFVTNAPATILTGQTQSGLVGVVASLPGKDGNVPPLAISVIPSPILNVDGVTNPLSTTGGLDEESDLEFNERFLDFIEGLGQASTAGLITGAKTVAGVRSAAVKEHIPPLSGLYHGTIYVDDGAGGASSALLAAVALVIDGDGSTANPGYRAAGLHYRVLAPTQVPINITLTATAEINVDKDLLKANIVSALTTYVNSLPIGRDVLVSRLIDTVMSVGGVYDQTMTVPAANVSIDDTQIARIGTLAVTVV